MKRKQRRETDKPLLPLFPSADGLWRREPHSESGDGYTEDDLIRLAETHTILRAVYTQQIQP